MLGLQVLGYIPNDILDRLNLRWFGNVACRVLTLVDHGAQLFRPVSGCTGRSLAFQGSVVLIRLCSMLVG